MCVWNAFLEENKGVHKLAARTAIRQSLWLEKNNYPEAGLLRASSTTQPSLKMKKKSGEADNYKIKINKAYYFDLQGYNNGLSNWMHHHVSQFGLDFLKLE